MTDGVKTPGVESGAKRHLGLDVDGTSAAFVDGRVCFDPGLKSYFIEHHTKWDSVAFITARLLRTSFRDIYREFTGKRTKNTTAMVDAHDAILDDIQAAMEAEGAPASLYYPQFLSPFDDEEGVSFVRDVLMPTENWFRELLKKEFKDAEHSPTFAKFIQLIERFQLKRYRRDSEKLEQVHALLVQFVFAQTDASLGERLAAFEYHHLR